jgi:hypothetical protein
MTENPILDWFKSDDILCDIVNEISATGKNLEEQALDAFHRLSDHYDLPKYPENFSDKYYERFQQMGVDDPRSVFEEATLWRYLEPEDDPRGIVMIALYNVRHGKFLDLNECAQKHFGSIPKEYMVCYTGEGFAGELHFLNPGESWFDLPGSKSACKVINS